MSEENNIKNFTAADIEKYWKGKLSAAEMHAMEKAAMDDPFFADALEGYQYANSADDDLNAVKEKLNKRTTVSAIVIPIKQKKFYWLRIAAAIIIIGGAGVFVQQLFFNNKNETPIGILKKQEESKSEVTSNKDIAPDSVKSLIPESDPLNNKNDKKQTNSEIVNSNPAAIINDTVKFYNYNNVVADTKTESEKIQAESSLAALKEGRRGSEVAKPSISNFAKDSVGVSARLEKKLSDGYVKTKNAEGFQDRESYKAVSLSNKYNYRVVDAQNNPVPFANVMNTRDNVGTYTDIRGNFNLLSSDSVLDVQIRSHGYLSNNYRLMPSPQSNALVLKEDENVRKQITQANRQLVTSVTRKDSAEIEEPEVGWGNYNVYVQNNIQIPENIRGKKTSADVELSFDIDKTGQPVNIKITKSSQCKECDEEAKRLLKVGPKWKRKGKKSKTTISIAIDQ